MCINSSTHKRAGRDHVAHNKKVATVTITAQVATMMQCAGRDCSIRAAGRDCSIRTAGRDGAVQVAEQLHVQTGPEQLGDTCGTGSTWSKMQEEENDIITVN